MSAAEVDTVYSREGTRHTLTVEAVTLTRSQAEELRDAFLVWFVQQTIRGGA